MKTKIGLVFATFALAAISFGLLSPAGSAEADDPDDVLLGEVDAAYFYGEDANMPRWLRYSIIFCAAKTLDLEVEQVKSGLRHGHSLKEIGIRAGVRPLQLENGILRCEQHLLLRLVNADKLEPGEARRIFNFLREHITRIINYSWEG
jgi:hypothetical protein